MSRQPSTSSSKYKISAPQPLVDQSLDRYPSDNGPYPSLAPTRPPQTHRPVHDRLASSESLASGSSLPSNHGNRSQSGPASGPMRPARSKMRQPPASSTSPARPDKSLRPTLFADTRRPSDSARAPVDLISPISPTSPDKPAPAFNDPFAADRSHRSELRNQYHQQSSTPMAGPASDKLRSAVGAFMSASKSSDSSKRPIKAESRHRARPQEVSWDNAADNGRFGELDIVVAKIKAEWPTILASDLSPSTLALSLLSPSSTTLPPHPSLSSFLQLHETLSTALQSSVQSHFQSFAASLPAHADFLVTLGRAQSQVKSSKQALRDARDGFHGGQKSELASVRARERTVRDILAVLDIM